MILDSVWVSMLLTRFQFLAVIKTKILLDSIRLTTVTSWDHEFSNRNFRKYLSPVAVDGFVVDHEFQLTLAN